MRHLKFFWLLLLPLLMLGVARAQDVRIVYPQEGQDVRGEITVRIEGIPAGGYASISVDGQFRQATAQDFVVLDTISDRVTFPHGDGTYHLDVTVRNAGGKSVGTASVGFNVANGKVDEAGNAVKLVHWTPEDRLNSNVQRYRVFAESDATISGGATAGADPAGGGGAGGASGSYLPSPLDWQVSALMRRILRDTNLLNGSANISTLVQESFQRQRLLTPVTSADAKNADGLHKGPWAHDLKGQPLWMPSSEIGKYFIKGIKQDGTEVNATRKAPTIAIADLLPTFPDVAVRPGSTWETTMSFVGDLSTRMPINVRFPITFTSYEDLQTPTGESRRCAKLESRFLLPDNLAKRVAAALANEVGSGAAPADAASTPATPAASAQGGTDAAAPAATFSENDIQVARTSMARVLWFDIERRRILRAEDTIRSTFEMPNSGASAATGQTPAGATDPSAVPTPPQVVDYNLNITTWLDDRIPNPTGQYVSGGFGAHTRDSVNELGLSRILDAKVAKH